MYIHNLPIFVITFFIIASLQLTYQVNSLDIFNTGSFFGDTSISIFASVIDAFKCRFYECCKSGWVHSTVPGLKNELKEKVYGQHIVVSATVFAIKAHLKNPNPKKALVLSFHGWAGCGKNYVAEIIAEQLFTNGMKSRFVHLFKGDRDFPDPAKSMEYKIALQSWIEGNVTECESRNLFIFDELQMMPTEVLDGIKPFIDYGAVYKQKNFAYSIFIFLSNTCGNQISLTAIDRWESGKSRESIKKQELERAITESAYNEDGALQKSRLIDSYLVDEYIPFLPLEKSHVRQCVRDELRWQNQSGRFPAESARGQKLVELVLAELDYYPPGNPVFAVTGCKRVRQKLSAVLQEMEDDAEEEEQHSDEEL